MTDRPFLASDDLERLARHAQEGDRLALEQFVATAQPDVWRYCVAVTGAADAEDVAQEALVRVVLALPRFRGDAPVRPWLVTIVRNTCMDWLRQQYRRRAAMERFSALRHDPRHHDVHRSDLTGTLQDLDPDRRDAFALTQLLGFSYQEAADICGCAVGTIRSRVARARIDLLERAEQEPSRGTERTV